MKHFYLIFKISFFTIRASLTKLLNNILLLLFKKEGYDSTFFISIIVNCSLDFLSLCGERSTLYNFFFLGMDPILNL